MDGKGAGPQRESAEPEPRLGPGCPLSRGLSEFCSHSVSEVRSVDVASGSHLDPFSRVWLVFPPCLRDVQQPGNAGPAPADLREPPADAERDLRPLHAQHDADACPEP